MNKKVRKKGVKETIYRSFLVKGNFFLARENRENLLNHDKQTPDKIH